MINLIIQELNSIHYHTALLEALDWDEGELSKVYETITQVLDRSQIISGFNMSDITIEEYLNSILIKSFKQKNLTNLQIDTIIIIITNEMKHLISDLNLPEA